MDSEEDSPTAACRQRPLRSVAPRLAGGGGLCPRVGSASAVGPAAAAGRLPTASQRPEPELGAAEGEDRWAASAEAFPEAPAVAAPASASPASAGQAGEAEGWEAGAGGHARRPAFRGGGREEASSAGRGGPEEAGGRRREASAAASAAPRLLAEAEAEAACFRSRTAACSRCPSSRSRPRRPRGRT